MLMVTKALLRRIDRTGCERRGMGKEEKLFVRDPDELVRNEKVRGLISDAIARVNSRLARHETIRGFALITDPFTTREDLLTPSLKVKRGHVIAKYSELVESLYQG